MRSLWLLLLLAPAAFGVVDGTVINKTTSKPQPNATVTLYKLGQAGMESLESVKSGPDGRFSIQQPAEGPHLVQTAFDGVTYNHMLPPNQPRTGLQLEVYNASNKPGQAKIRQHAILFEPLGTELSVREIYFFENSGLTAWNDPENGTLRFYVPDGTRGKVEVNATAPQGMPIQRAAEKTSQADVLKVDFPIKPGETTIELSYKVPFTTPGTYSGRILQGAEATRLVTPNGVTLKGANIESEGQEPRSQAHIYKLNGRSFQVEIEGTSMRPTEGEEGGPSIGVIKPRLYENLYLILGISLAILALGFLLLYKRGDVVEAPKGKRGK